MARLYRKELTKIPAIKIVYKVEAKNGVFAEVPAAVIAELQKRYFFYVWNEQQSVVRWMCSFGYDPEQDVKELRDSVAQTLRADFVTFFLAPESRGRDYTVGLREPGRSELFVGRRRDAALSRRARHGRTESISRKFKKKSPAANCWTHSVSGALRSREARSRCSAPADAVNRLPHDLRSGIWRRLMRNLLRVRRYCSSTARPPRPRRRPPQ